MSWSVLDNQGRIKKLLQQQGINPTHQVLVGSGTYTLPSGCTSILVECIGGGGAGGGSPTTSASNCAAGGGGGGGAYASSLIVNPAASYAYSVGAGGTGVANATGNAGGDSTFGSTIVVAKGGGGGGQAPQSTVPAFYAGGGAGGSAGSSTGDTTLNGEPGGRGLALNVGSTAGGVGGMAARGGGGAPLTYTTAANGTAGASPGGGGSGGANDQSQAATTTGGAGAAGTIVVTEFYGAPTVNATVPLAPTKTIFTSGSGTYTPPGNAKAIFVECLAGGGGGGTAQTGSNATYAASSGGNGGCYANKMIPNPATSYAYAVGAGGAGGTLGGGTCSNGNAGADTTFGSSTVVAKGGVGGTLDGQAGHTSFATVDPTTPSTSGCVGDFFSAGTAGGEGQVIQSGVLFGGAGGAGAGPYAGSPAPIVSAAGTHNGNNAIGLGGGGSGGTAGTFSGSACLSGGGGNGILVITEYYTIPATVGVSANPYITGQDWSLGPPSSPGHGDIWYATNVDANGHVWTFRYNAYSTSASKWEFVGGSPLFVSQTADNTSVTATSYTFDSTGPTWTPARAGDFNVLLGMRTDGTEGQQSVFGMGQSSITVQVNVNDRDLTDWNSSAQAGTAIALAAGSPFQTYIYNTGGAGSPARQFTRWLQIQPIRVA